MALIQILPSVVVNNEQTGIFQRLHGIIRRFASDHSGIGCDKVMFRKKSFRELVPFFVYIIISKQTIADESKFLWYIALTDERIALFKIFAHDEAAKFSLLFSRNVGNGPDGME